MRDSAPMGSSDKRIGRAAWSPWFLFGVVSLWPNPSVLGFNVVPQSSPGNHEMRTIGSVTFWTGVLTLVIGPCVSSTQPLQPPDRLIAIRGARLIDGTGSPPVDDAVVIVDGDRIRAAGSRAGVEVPRDATVVDATRKVVLPGLVDVHCHINQPPDEMKRYWIA